MGNLIVRNARVVDGVSDIIRDLYVANGHISSAYAADSEIIDAAGMVVIPGLVDMHVHFRDPGQTYKEDILSGANAAAAGGVTTCVCMPNTKPAADCVEVLAYILDRAKNACVRVLPYAAVTIGQNGETITDFAKLRNAGAAAFSDDGNPVMNAEIMRKALILSAETGTLISSHCEDISLVKNYALNEGVVSKKLGLRGRPASAEEIMIARDAILAAETGARVHIAHVSTAGSIEIIRRAKEAGVKISCETCPQYFMLTEDIIPKLGPLARVNPPLRTERDRLAIVESLKDGTIDAIATDHAPHTDEEKSLPIEEAPSGMIGLETSLAAALTGLYHTGIIPLARIVELMCSAPARLLGLDAGTLKPGAPADFVIVNPDTTWEVEAKKFRSRAKNSAFIGMKLQGQAVSTYFEGVRVFCAADLSGG